MARSSGVSSASSVVVGLGNPYCTDDGVGTAVARALGPWEGAEIWESIKGGLALAEEVRGFRRVLLIDAAPFLQPGEFAMAPLSELEARGGERKGPHGINLSRALEVLSTLRGAPGPEGSVGACPPPPSATSQTSCSRTSQTSCDATETEEDDVGRCGVPEVWALAIGIPPNPPFGEGLSPEVAASLPAALEEVRKWLKN